MTEQNLKAMSNMRALKLEIYGIFAHKMKYQSRYL